MGLLVGAVSALLGLAWLHTRLKAKAKPPWLTQGNTGADDEFGRGRAMPVAFRMIRDSHLQKWATAGTIVYECLDHDYGLAKNDSRQTGIEHISVTLNKYGEGPFFTVPVRDLEYADGSGRTIETPGYADDGPL
jgi:hypothetical protein